MKRFTITGHDLRLHITVYASMFCRPMHVQPKGHRTCSRSMTCCLLKRRTSIIGLLAVHHMLLDQTPSPIIGYGFLWQGKIVRSRNMSFGHGIPVHDRTCLATLHMPQQLDHRLCFAMAGHVFVCMEHVLCLLCTFHGHQLQDLLVECYIICCHMVCLGMSTNLGSRRSYS